MFFFRVFFGVSFFVVLFLIFLSQGKELDSMVSFGGFGFLL